MNVEKLVTVRQAAQRIPALTEAALRSYIFNARENGLEEAGAIRRVGRRVFLDLEALGRWIDEQGA